MPRQFASCADEVRAMVDQGASLGTIEAEIAGWPLSADELSALWLLAWANRPRPARPNSAQTCSSHLA